MRLLLTRELGRLAKWLRILGLDAEYCREDKLGSLIVQALKDNRIILTRNQRLAQDRGIRIIVIKEEKIKAQLRQVLKELKISAEADSMFTRCILCNEELAAIAKEEVKKRVPEYVFKTKENFITCPKCQRIYWQGTHWGNVQEVLKDII